jgi:hypothetical protein
MNLNPLRQRIRAEHRHREPKAAFTFTTTPVSLAFCQKPNVGS